MDCRRHVVLTLGLLATAGGCAHTGNSDIAAPAVTKAIVEGAEVHKAEDLPKRTPQTSTLVSFGDLYQRGALEPGRTPAQKQQMQEQARKAYQQALKIDPKCVPAHLSLARLYDDTGDHVRAVASFRKALELKPKDGAVWHELGMCYARAKEWDKALEGLTTAADLDRENKLFSRELGFCLARAGYYKESYAALCRTESEAAAHFDVARMLHHVQQDELSKQHLRLALQADPKLAQAQNLLAELETGIPAGGPAANPVTPLQIMPVAVPAQAGAGRS